MHNISLTNGWNLTILAQIHHKDGAKKCLDFGDLDLIFKVITLQILKKASLVNAVKSLCVHYLFNQWLEFDQTNTDTSPEWGKDVIRFL